MLIQLVVKNFKSIRDEQILDFYSHKRKTKSQKNTVELERCPFKIFPTIALIGANAAGKTTILEALNVITESILNKEFIPNQGVSFYQPHILSFETKNAPTCFELEFVLPKKINGCESRYLYSLEYTNLEIIKEELYNFSTKNRKSCLYSRQKGADGDVAIKFGSSLSGGKKSIPFFKNQTFLSVVRMTPDVVPELQDVAKYLCGEFELDEQIFSKDDFSLEHLGRLFLPYADVGILDVHRKEFDMNMLLTSSQKGVGVNNKELEEIKKIIPENFNYHFEHLGKDNCNAEIWYKHESQGTQSFFKMLPMIVNVLKNGATWICDELDHSLHPYLISLILQMFNDSQVNVNNAQLIFTTQNTAILEQDILTKEQILLVEKHEGASEVFSLADFKGTNNVDLNKWYLDGRFGGVPALDYYTFAENVKKILLG